jgi:hypothetical protein
MVSVLGAPKLVSGYVVPSSRYLGTKLYKALDIFCMETESDFFGKKHHFIGNGSFE